MFHNIIQAQGSWSQVCELFQSWGGYHGQTMMKAIIRSLVFLHKGTCFLKYHISFPTLDGNLYQLLENWIIFPLFFFSISRKYVAGRNLACFFSFTWRLKLECSTTVDFFQYVNQITFVFTAVELIMMSKNVAGKYIILSYSLRVRQAHLFMSMIAP